MKHRRIHTWPYMERNGRVLASKGESRQPWNELGGGKLLSKVLAGADFDNILTCMGSPWGGKTKIISKARGNMEAGLSEFSISRVELRARVRVRTCACVLCVRESASLGGLREFVAFNRTREGETVTQHQDRGRESSFVQVGMRKNVSACLEPCSLGCGDFSADLGNRDCGACASLTACKACAFPLKREYGKKRRDRPSPSKESMGRKDGTERVREKKKHGDMLKCASKGWCVKAHHWENGAKFGAR